MLKCTLVSNIIKDGNLARANEAAERIRKLSDDFIVKAVIEMKKCQEHDFEDTDIIMVLGGDGTFLSVAQDTSEKRNSLGNSMPIIGVNNGNLGFLTEVEYENIEYAVKYLLENEDKIKSMSEDIIEERMMLKGYKLGNDEVKINALNDVVLSRRTVDIQIVGYGVSVNGHHLKDFWSDGIIISTPTGSTAYNMSAGGPIVEPKAKLIVLTPVCPHSSNARSIILSANDKIQIKILPPKGNKPVKIGAYFDGRPSIELEEGDILEVTQSNEVTGICKIYGEGFLKVLQDKMKDR